MLTKVSLTKVNEKGHLGVNSYLQNNGPVVYYAFIIFFDDLEMVES